MTFPVVPPEGGSNIDQARELGRQLAAHPLLAARAGDQPPELAEVLADARPLMSAHGVAFEVVRTRPGCVVVRSHANGPLSARAACEVVKALLAEVTEEVCDIRAALVENVCAQRGAAACVYSIVWEDAATGSPRADLPPPPGPETLVDPDLSLGEWRPPVPEPLVDWNRPVPPGPEPLGPLPGAPAQPAVPSVPGAPDGGDGRLGVGGSSLGTSATSTTHHFQVSTPNTIVIPAPAPVRPPAPEFPAVTPGPERVVVTPPVRRVPRGLIRRSWLVALALLAGSAGGWFAGKHAATSYGAQATVVVRSGSSASGPGGANDATTLATTYAALIPKDQSILAVAGRTIGVSPAVVGHDLSVTVENGTSVMVIDYSASDPASAIKGARAVAGAVASATPVSLAIGPDSVAVVSEPTSAHLQGTLHKYGVVIGGLLGLMVGLVLVLAAERADPRIDEAAALAEASGCKAAAVPDGVSFPELGRVLAEAGRADGSLTIVPLTIADTAPTMEIARELRPWWPADGPAVRVSPAFSSGVVELARGSGPTVLISHPGTRQRDVLVATQRLRMIGRGPAWALLMARRHGPGLHRRVG